MWNGYNYEDIMMVLNGTPNSFYSLDIDFQLAVIEFSLRVVTKYERNKDFNIIDSILDNGLNDDLRNEIYLNIIERLNDGVKNCKIADNDNLYLVSLKAVRCSANRIYRRYISDNSCSVKKASTEDVNAVIDMEYSKMGRCFENPEKSAIYNDIVDRACLDSMDKDIYKYYKYGLSIVEISEKLNVHRKTVQYRLFGRTDRNQTGIVDRIKTAIEEN